MKKRVTITPRTKSILEVSAGSFLIFGYIWLVYPLYKTYWLHAASIAMFIGLLIWSRHSRKETDRQIGFRLDNFISSGKILFSITLGCLIILIAVKSLFYRIDFQFFFERTFWLRLIQYPFWALLQQYVFLAFFFRRFKEAFHPYLTPAILVSAITFSMVHIPNPPLMIFTFLGGLFWSWVYYKRPNLFVISISHAAFGVFCCHIISVYTMVGPFADIRWSKEHPIDYAIRTVKGTEFRHKEVLLISKANNSSVTVEGWARATKGQIEKVFVRFGSRYYLASYNNSGFHAEIPISNLKPGYYRLSIKVSVKDRFFCHYPSRRMWIRIQQQTTTN